MALVNCPECNKEISDKASSCPNCGYKIPHLEKEMKTKKNIKIILEVLVVIIALFTAFKIITKEHSPFEKFSPQMTKEEVRKIFGNAYMYDGEFNVDYYENISFMGLNGKISVWYRSNSTESIDHVYWDFALSEGETFADYSKQIEKITEFFTEQYGLPTEKYGYTVWEDTVGQEYMLELDSNTEYSSFDSEITIKYQP